jgi:hypothetical protein
MIIRRWLHQNNYEGLDYSDYYVAAQRLFRANAVARHNFEYIREHLHGAADNERCPGCGYEHPERDGGCVHGWYDPAKIERLNVIDVAFEDECLIARYMVLVHKDFAKGVRMAEMFAQRLADKGYVDPEVTSDDEEEDHAKMQLSMSQLPVNAPTTTGRYKAIVVATGHQGFTTTTYSVQRKSVAREREAEKIKQVAAEISQITGGPVQLVARPIDGIVRRWTATRRYNEDDTRDPVEK